MSSDRSWLGYFVHARASEYLWCNPPSIALACTERKSSNRCRDFDNGTGRLAGGSGRLDRRPNVGVRGCNAPPKHLPQMPFRERNEPGRLIYLPARWTHIGNGLLGHGMAAGFPCFTRTRPACRNTRPLHPFAPADDLYVLGSPYRVQVRTFHPLPGVTRVQVRAKFRR
jgi:hypothetical protein